jgi:hypothetical protein
MNSFIYIHDSRKKANAQEKRKLMSVDSLTLYSLAAKTIRKQAGTQE